MIINGDSFQELKKLEDASVDSIVTDPPYDIGFMNKKWDKKSLITNVEFWKECMRVLKPGGHLLAFGHSRTSHRMVTAVEDAGFEIRDTIMWMYGCLSEDSEVLTRDGWKLYDQVKDKEIMIYDVENDLYKWEKPAKWFVYPVNKDTVFHIKNDYTDQLVSRNHRCLVERDGKLVFVKAEDLSTMERVPTLQEHFYSLSQSEGQLLQQRMQWKSKRPAMERTRPQRKRGMDTGEYSFLPTENEWFKQPSLERGYNLQKQKRLLSKSKNKVCKVSNRVSTNGKKRWLCSGIQVGDGSTNRQTTNEARMCASHRSQPREQYNKQLNVIQQQQRSQTLRMGTTYNTSVATITEKEYTGIIFCPNTSTGAFVARRNGQVFITGNSGFPKSHNVAIAIDKKLGKMGHRGKRASFNGERAILDKDMPAAVGVEQHQAISDEAKEWQGWGTALKPAYEPVVMARKPLGEKSVADNVLKHGTGAINIDDSRVSYDNDGEDPATNPLYRYKNKDKYKQVTDHGQRVGANVSFTNSLTPPNELGRFPANVILDEEAGQLLDEQAPKVGNGHRAKTKITGYGKNYGGTQEYDGPGEKLDGLGGASRFFHKVQAEPQGRFPANVILDEEAGQLLDEQSGFSKTTANKNYKHDKTACEGNTFTNRGTYTPREDSGGASRFFYCAKVATRERKLEEGKNNHPTVKPVKLMEYLVKLVTRKGGVVLDPFAGSGSTGVAAKNLGMKYILIEREEEYCDIIRARLKEK